MPFLGTLNVGGGGVPDAIATGGTETTYTGDGTNGTNGVGYRVHTFTSSGSLTVSKAGMARVLIIGGGNNGGGQGDYSNGGHGGGFAEYNTWLPAGTVTITVGAGGGNPSSIDLFAAASNVVGHGAEYGVGANGFFGGGGGGGAGGAGSSGGSHLGGNGGVGKQTYINGSSQTLAGGGGGSGYDNPGGTGQNGGGNGGRAASAGTNGTANTGGGGGSGSVNYGSRTGGSGIVYVRVVD